MIWCTFRMYIPHSSFRIFHPVLVPFQTCLPTITREPPPTGLSIHFGFFNRWIFVSRNYSTVWRKWERRFTSLHESLIGPEPQSWSRFRIPPKLNSSLPKNDAWKTSSVWNGPFLGDVCLFFVGGGGVDATNSLFRFSFVFVYTWIFSIDTLLDGYV